MDIRNLDLNLLGALEVLVAERNVTRAGQRLGLSQPAMSYTLSKLREYLDDPVLVRTPGGMMPTPRAEQLAAGVARALDELSTVLKQDEQFDPREAQQQFKVAFTDHTSFAIAPTLAARLAEHAPGVNVEVRTFRAEKTWSDLAAGQIDLAVWVGSFDNVPAGLYRRGLFREDFVTMVREGHPRIRKKLTLKAYVETPHILVSPRGGLHGLVDEALEKKGLKRRVVMAVPHFLVAPMIVARSDLLVTMTDRVALPFAEILPLRVFKPPVEVKGGEWCAVWHERTHHDPAHRWLRDQIAQSVEEADAACRARPRL